MKGDINFNTAKSIMKLRLNMLEVKNNYKGTTRNDACDLCADKIDTTKHLFFNARRLKTHKSS